MEENYARIVSCTFGDWRQAKEWQLKLYNLICMIKERVGLLAQRDQQPYFHVNKCVGVFRRADVEADDHRPAIRYTLITNSTATGPQNINRESLQENSKKGYAHQFTSNARPGVPSPTSS